MIDFASQRLLRTHIWHGSHYDTRFSLRHRTDVAGCRPRLISRDLCQAKIEHLYLAARGEHHVRRFNIAVRDSLAVRFVQGVRDLAGDLYNFMDLKRMAIYFSCEGLALDIFHRDEAHALGLADFIDVRNIRMIERRGGLRLADEALHPLCIRRDLCGQYL